MKRKVSVLITTKNRKDHVVKCLESIYRQTVIPAEIIIVDASNTPQNNLVNIFKEKLLIRYYYRPSTNIPEGRNICMQMASNQLALFIDDDCRASRTWVEEMLVEYSRYTNATVILGKVIHLPKTGIYAKIIQSIHQYRRKVSQNTDSPFIDTSNCLLSLNNLRRKKVRFDTSMPRGEDSDLLFQIIEKGGKTYSSNKAIVYHYERNTLLSFLHQRFINAGNLTRLASKWPKKEFYFYTSDRYGYINLSQNLILPLLKSGHLSAGIRTLFVLILSAIFYEIGHLYFKMRLSLLKLQV